MEVIGIDCNSADLNLHYQMIQWIFGVIFENVDLNYYHQKPERWYVNEKNLIMMTKYNVSNFFKKMVLTKNTIDNSVKYVVQNEKTIEKDIKPNKIKNRKPDKNISQNKDKQCHKRIKFSDS